MSTTTSGPDFCTLASYGSVELSDYRNAAYGITDDPDNLEKIADRIQDAAYTAWATRLTDHGIYLHRDGSSTVYVGDEAPNALMADGDALERLRLDAEADISEAIAAELDNA